LKKNELSSTGMPTDSLDRLLFLLNHMNACQVASILSRTSSQWDFSFEECAGSQNVESLRIQEGKLSVRLLSVPNNNNVFC